MNVFQWCINSMNLLKYFLFIHRLSCMRKTFTLDETSITLWHINFQWIFTTCLDFKGLLWKWKLFSKLHNDHFKIFIFVKLYINTEGIKYYFFRLMIPVQDLTPYSKRNLLIKSEKKPSTNLHFQIHWKYMKMGILMYW